MRILTVIGARPQFIKAVPVSGELRKQFDEILVHTGQHYDKNMSDIFFKELNIPKPHYNLGIGSGTHAMQTGKMLIGIEEIILKENPYGVIVYGDTNSTLAGALAAAKLNIPVIHIEAGLRSFNRNMPEEKNRVITDHISTLLLCPDKYSVENLRIEGIIEGVYNVGDVMLDTLLSNIKIAEKKFSCVSIMNELRINSCLCEKHRNLADIEKYYLATVHRAENTGNHEKMVTIMDAFELLNHPVLMPVHPGTANKLLPLAGKYRNVIFIEPVGYLEMLYLILKAEKVITDSGGLQKEAYFIGVPCVTLRDETEWIETLQGGWNVLTRISISEILKNTKNECIYGTRKLETFGDGRAAKKVAEIIRGYLK